MQFKELTLRNFLVFGDETQTIQLDKQGLVLIDGDNEDANSFQSNGSGKSSLLNAITYALYGNLPNGVGGDDVINNKVKKNMCVTLTFVIDGNTYQVQRYRKDKTNKNKVFLYRNEENITQASVKKTNDYLQQLLGIAEETFLNSILFGMGGKFKFTQATDAEKKKLLEDIANISIFKRAQVVAKADLKELQDQHSALELTKANIARTLDNYKVQVESNQKALAFYNEQLETLKQRLATASQKYQNVLQQYQNDDWQTVLPDIQAKKQQLDTKIKELAGKRTQAQDTAAYKLQGVKHELANVQKQLNDAKQAATDAYQQLKELSESTQPVCPFCKQPLDSEHLLQEVERCKQNYKDAAVQITQLEGQIDQYQAQVNQLLPQVKQEQEESNNFEALLQQQQEYNQSLQQEAQAKQNVQLAQQDYNLAKTAADNPPKQPDLYQLSKDEVNETKQEYDKVEKELAELQTKIQQLSDTVEIYSDRGVVSQVLDLVMPFINQQANYYLSQLTDNSIVIDINPQTKSKNGNISEKLDINITNLNGGDEYELNSTGEKKRIDLAISLALQDYVMSKEATQTNLIGYDEIFDGLDGIGTQRVMGLLKDRVKNVASVFVISHNTELQELFEHSIKVTKIKGVSTIEQET